MLGSMTEAARFRHVVVPIDGSDLSCNALGPAMSLASAFDGVLHLVAVVVNEADGAAAHRGLESVAQRFGIAPVAVSVVEALDIADAIADAIADVGEQLQPSFLCMATHGRGRVAGSLLGSVAMSAFARARRPAVLVGPNAPGGAGRIDGPVVACVDGSTASEAVLPVAVSWAAALSLSLRIVTVAEPVPAPMDNRPYHRGFGPDIDADVYVERLAKDWQRDGMPLEGRAIYHPMGPAEGIAEHLRDAPAGLVAVTTHARTGLARAMVGSVTARVVHDSPAPVLIVPLASA
jgi:nucleotide-binding universal stress UspA family protein